MWKKDKQFWKEYQEARRKKRWEDAKSSIATMDANKIQYELRRQDTMHFLVEKEIDFWPTKGTWRNRRTKQYGKGIQSLIWEALKIHAEHNDETI